MGGFYTSNVAKIELHDFVAIVNLQAHCIWFQRRNFVKLTIKHVVIGGATNDVAPLHEPKSLIIKLMRRFDICAAVLVVQKVVYLFVEFLRCALLTVRLQSGMSCLYGNLFTSIRTQLFTFWLIRPT